MERKRVANAIQLAYDNLSFSELPKISLVAQQSLDRMAGPYLFIFRVNDNYYKIVTDNNVNKIQSTQKYASYQDLKDNKECI